MTDRRVRFAQGDERRGTTVMKRTCASMTAMCLGMLCLAVCVGCESSAPSTGQAVPIGPPQPPDPAVAAAEQPAAEGQPAQPPAEGADPAAAPPAEGTPTAAPAPGAAPPAAGNAPMPQPAAPEGDANLKKAEAGVGVKGKDY